MTKGGTADSGMPPDNSTCTLTANTTATATKNANGCYVLTRDASACQAARTTQGLSGVWLKFSCRVALTMSTDNGAAAVAAVADGQPDYKSFVVKTFIDKAVAMK